jgi:hypothetical protein
VSAGTVTVSGGGASFTIAPSGAAFADAGASVDYQLAIPDAGMVSAGETFTLAASGATAPAFSASIAVPEAVILTLPAFGGPSAAVVIPRSTDLPVAWSGGGTGYVVFSIDQTVGGTATSVSCSFPETAGSGVVPAELLGHFTPSNEIDAGSLPFRPTSASAYTLSTQTVVAGGWTMVATIAVSSLIPGGALVTVQ